MFYPQHPGGAAGAAPGMDVLDVDGERIGRVVHVHRTPPSPHPAGGASAAPGARDDADAVLEVRTGFFGVGRRLYLPASIIQTVAAGCVFVNEPRQAIEARAWWRGWYAAPRGPEGRSGGS